MVFNVFKKKSGGSRRNESPDGLLGVGPCKVQLEGVRDCPEGGDIGVWMVRKGYEKEGKKEVSVFISRGKAVAGGNDAVKEGGEFYEVLMNAVKNCLLEPSSLREPVSCAAEALTRHKAFRHPHILPYISGGLSPTKDIQIITETCTTLRHRLSTTQITIDEVCLGVSCIAKTLQWLHQCNLAYNNVSLDGIFVTRNPTKWVLGDFSFTCPREAGDIVQHSMRYQNIVAPEDVYPYRDVDGNKRRRSCGKVIDLAMRDIYGLGCVIDVLLKKVGEEGVADMRSEILKEVLQDAESTGDEIQTPGFSAMSSSASFESQIENRGLEALLGELATAIEWIDKDSLPTLPLVTFPPTPTRALTASEELFLWAIKAMHRSPVFRPSLQELIEGRFVQENILVQTYEFLSEKVLFATQEDKRAGYDLVKRCLERSPYHVATEIVVPMLCSRNTFLDTECDAVYEKVLTPRKPPPVLGDVLDATVSTVQTVPEEGVRAEFEKGKEVQIVGLKRNAELNGHIGCVVGYDDADGRVLVVIGNEHRAIQPKNLLKPEGTAGTLLPIDYQVIVVPFLKQALRDKLDGPMRVALLRRAKYYLGTFDHGGMLTDVQTCLNDAKQRVELRAAACEAVPALIRSASLNSKTVNALVVSVHKLIQSTETPQILKAAAITATINTWGYQCPGYAVSAAVTGLHSPLLTLPTLKALQEALSHDAISPEEISGTLVPLISPLILSPSKEVRQAAQAALNNTFAVLAKMTGTPAFPPPRPLPSASTLLATLPRAAR